MDLVSTTRNYLENAGVPCTYEQACEVVAMASSEAMYNGLELKRSHMRLGLISWFMRRTSGSCSMSLTVAEEVAEIAVDYARRDYKRNERWAEIRKATPGAPLLGGDDAPEAYGYVLD